MVKQRRINPNLEMLPLIDVMFLLLIFFIYAVANVASTKQLPVDLPTVMEALIPAKDYQQIIIQKDKIQLNGNDVSFSTLGSLRSDKKVYLAIDKRVKFSRVAKVLGILKTNHIDKISLETK